MSSAARSQGVYDYRPDYEDARASWGWFLALGIIQILAGIAALVLTVAATFITVIAIGIVALIAAVAEVVSIFWSRRWEEGLFHAFAGILYGAFGVMILINPGLAVVTLTFVLAALLVVSGIFRMILAASTGFRGWGWAVLSGAVSLLLGILIWAGWPESSLWVIGLFVGIDLIFLGTTWVVLALALRNATWAPDRNRDVPALPAT